MCQPLHKKIIFAGMTAKVDMNLGRCRAPTPLLGNGAGAHVVGKISGVLTEIGKFDIILMYDVSIARLIPIIELTLVYYEKRERKKQVLL